MNQNQRTRIVPRDFMRMAVSVISITLLLGGCRGSVKMQRIDQWPAWQDIETSASPENVWKTTLDVLTERHAIAVSDRSAGYVRTEWTNESKAEEWRWTAKIFPDENRVRIGFESRVRKSQRYVQQVSTDPQSIFRQVPTELQDRLRSNGVRHAQSSDGLPDKTVRRTVR